MGGIQMTTMPIADADVVHPSFKSRPAYKDL